MFVPNQVAELFLLVRAPWKVNGMSFDNNRHSIHEEWLRVGLQKAPVTKAVGACLL